ncbi:hypothetical protein OTU49_013737, partial [Cherax quadricarinatus]
LPQQESTVPSAPPLSHPGSPSVATISNTYQRHRYGLELITNLHQVCISTRRGDSYVFTDTTRSLLYTAAIDMEIQCWCYNAPKGPGITFNLTNRNGQHVLVVQRTICHSSCTDTETTMTVHVPPDVILGTIELKDLHCVLCNPSGDIVCEVDQDVSCCSCGTPPYQVTPAGFPRDTGSIVSSSDGLLITFPAVLDVSTRTLLLCCALNLQYTKEE